MNESRSALPWVVFGLLIAFGLIWLASGGQPGRNQALEQQFKPRPLAPGEPTPAPFQLPQVSLPELPPDVQQAVAAAENQLRSGGAVPALTPVAESGRARVTVTEVRREGEVVRVRGEVGNLAGETLEIPPGAFSFRDSAGTNYATTGTGGATLAPGQGTAFDLTVPLPEGYGLALILTIPPDPPLEQVLVVAVAPAAP
jgi:hypothetical protein